MQGPNALLNIITIPPGALPGQQRIVIDGTRGAIFEYAAGAGLGNTIADNPLVSSWAAMAGTDPFGSAYPEGFSIGAGSVFEGTDFIMDSNGLFFYTGTPAAGNLFLALAPQAGSDEFGNPYIAGVQYTDPNGFQIQITNQGGAGVVRFLTNRSGEASGAIIASQVFNEGASNESLNLSFFGPRETSPDNDCASITLESSAKDGSSSAQGIIGILPNLSGTVTPEAAWDADGLYAYANDDGNKYDTARGTLILGSPLTIDNTSGQTVLTVDIEPGIYAIDGFCECIQGTTAVAQNIGFGGPTAVTPTRIRYWFVEQGAAQEFSEYSNFGSGLGDAITPAYGAGDTFWFEFKGWVRFSASGAFGITAASATTTETFTVENAFMNLRPCTRTVLE